MGRRCVRSRNLKNEEAVTRVGSQRHGKKKESVPSNVTMTSEKLLGSDLERNGRGLF